MRHKLNTFILKNPPEDKVSKAEKRSDVPASSSGSSKSRQMADDHSSHAMRMLDSTLIIHSLVGIARVAAHA